MNKQNFTYIYSDQSQKDVVSSSPEAALIKAVLYSKMLFKEDVAITAVIDHERGVYYHNVEFDLYYETHVFKKIENIHKSFSPDAVFKILKSFADFADIDHEQVINFCKTIDV